MDKDYLILKRGLPTFKLSPYHPRIDGRKETAHDFVGQ